jgi:hypothetical protein
MHRPSLGCMVLQGDVGGIALLVEAARHLAESADVAAVADGQPVKSFRSGCVRP